VLHCAAAVAVVLATGPARLSRTSSPAYQPQDSVKNVPRPPGPGQTG
jgi:hypothetical protein